MWRLRNETPFMATPSFVRDQEGRELWIIAVKATFVVGPDGAVRVAEEQPPPQLKPVHHGRPGASSLRYDSDLVEHKAGTDVILNGHAHAPRGRPVTVVDTHLQLGPISKRLRVFGDRVWRRSVVGIEPGEPEPWTSIPLIYERSFGGIDASANGPHDREPRNWVGVGYSARSSPPVGQRLANIEWPNALITSWRQRPEPAGYGAVERHWHPRAGFGGTYDAQWAALRHPRPPLDLVPRYYNSAPTDQQTGGFLRGGEPVVLTGFTPDQPIAFTLPEVHLGFRTLFERHSEAHEGRLHTVILEPELRRVSLVFQSCLPCQGRDHLLEQTIIYEKRRIARR